MAELLLGEAVFKMPMWGFFVVVFIFSFCFFYTLSRFGCYLRELGEEIDTSQEEITDKYSISDEEWKKYII